MMVLVVVDKVSGDGGGELDAVMVAESVRVVRAIFMLVIMLVVDMVMVLLVVVVMGAL